MDPYHIPDYDVDNIDDVDLQTAFAFRNVGRELRGGRGNGAGRGVGRGGRGGRPPRQPRAAAAAAAQRVSQLRNNNAIPAMDA